MHATCAMYSSYFVYKCISQMIVNINCHYKVVSRHHVLSYVNLTLNDRHKHLFKTSFILFLLQNIPILSKNVVR